MRPVARRQLVVAGVLVAALLLGLGLMRLRSGGGGNDAVGTTAAGRAAGDGEPPGSAPAEVGNPRLDRTAAGVRAAALAYAAGVQQSIVYVPDAEARKVLAGWMAPGVDPGELDRTAAALETTRKALLATRGQAWWAVSPLAAKAGPFTPERAQISVWLVRVLGSGGASGGYIPTAGWLTASVELVWVDGPGWSVWSVNSTPGPVPGATVSERPAASAEFITALEGFSLVKEHR